MMALFGALLGFISSAFPELLKMAQDRKDKEHELALLDKQMKWARQGHSERLEEMEVQAQAGERIALYQHDRPSHVLWVEALSGSVRPLLTYAFFGLYALLKIALWHQSLLKGHSWDQSLVALWGSEDEALFAAVMSFWFGQRSLRKKG